MELPNESEFRKRLEETKRRQAAIAQLREAVALAMDAGYTLDQIVNWVDVAIADWEFDRKMNSEE